MRAYFTEGRADRRPRDARAADGGDRARRDEARAVLDGDAYADAVRADEELAQRIGIQGVPFFVLDRRYGVSGAQPAGGAARGAAEARGGGVMRLSVLDQSPVPEGSTGAGGAAQHARPRAARRRARLPPLLARRAPRAVARRAEPGGADRAGRGRDRAHPRRQRRRDAAALLAVQGRRELQPARRPVPGADRPRDRPRVRHRPDDDVRAPARPPPGLARRLPAAARRAARALRPQLPGRPSVRAARPLAARRRGAAGDLAARLVARRARSGRRSSTCRTRSPTSSTRSGAEIAAVLPRAGREPAHARSACGRSAPTPTRRPSGSRPRSRCRWRCCARAARSRCRRPRRRCASSPRRRPGAAGRRRIVGRPDTVRAGIEEVAAEYGADEVIVVTITHDHDARRRSYELIAEAFGLAGIHDPAAPRHRGVRRADCPRASDPRRCRAANRL